MAYARVSNPFFAPPAVNYANPGVDRETLPLFTDVGPYQIRYFRLPGMAGIGWEVVHFLGGPVFWPGSKEELWSPPGQGGSRTVAGAEKAARAAIADLAPQPRKRSWEVRVNKNPAQSDFEVFLIHKISDLLEGVRDKVLDGVPFWDTSPLVVAAMKVIDAHADTLNPHDPHLRSAREFMARAWHNSASGGSARGTVWALNLAANNLHHYAQGWVNATRSLRNPFFAPPAVNYTQNPLCEPNPEVHRYVVKDKAGRPVALLQAHNLDDARQRAASHGFSGRKFQVNREGAKANPGGTVFYVYVQGEPDPIGSVQAKTERSALTQARKRFGRSDLTVVDEAGAHAPGQMFSASAGLTAEDEKRLKREATGGQEFLF